MDPAIPGAFFSNSIILLCLGGGLYFLIKAASHTAWGERGEEPKYRMLQDDEYEPKEAYDGR